jgi:hypothetical protein
MRDIGRFHRIRIALALAGVAGVLAFHFFLAPWIVKLHYVHLFAKADEIIISRYPPPASPVTIRRSTSPEAFAHLEMAVGNGYVRPYQCQCIPSFKLDIVARSGLRVNGVQACHFLKSPRQPFARSFWFYPRLYPGGDPDVVEEIKRIYQAASSQPPGARR